MILKLGISSDGGRIGHRVAVLFQNPKQSKAKQTLLLALFDPLKIQAKQSKVHFVKSKTRSKAKQSKVKQSKVRSGKIFRKFWKKFKVQN